MISWHVGCNTESARFMGLIFRQVGPVSSAAAAQLLCRPSCHAGSSLQPACQLLRNTARCSAQAAPGSVALVVACEPITLGMAPSNDLDCVSNLALMRTGAAAVLLTSRCCARMPRYQAVRSHLHLSCCQIPVLLVNVLPCMSQRAGSPGRRRDRARAKYELLHATRILLPHDAAFSAIQWRQDAAGVAGLCLRAQDIFAAASAAVRANLTALAPLVLPLPELVHHGSSVRRLCIPLSSGKKVLTSEFGGETMFTQPGQLGFFLAPLQSHPLEFVQPQTWRYEPSLCSWPG